MLGGFAGAFGPRTESMVKVLLSMCPLPSYLSRVVAVQDVVEGRPGQLLDTDIAVAGCVAGVQRGIAQRCGDAARGQLIAANVHTGAAIPGLLGALRIPSRVVSEVDELRTSLVEARRSMDTSLHPVSIIMSGRITKG